MRDEKKIRYGGIQRQQVSVRGSVYNRIKAEAKARGVTIGQIVEAAVAPALDAVDVTATVPERGASR